MSERTNERSFFNLRYALPGYTFILLTLLINLRALLYFLLKIIPGLGQSETVLSVLGILFGFLTLMSGSAVGFLVSQCWYIVYHTLHYFGLALGISKRFGSYRVLIEECGVKDSIRSLETEFNYAVHTSEPQGIRTYFNRRWDLLMLFGSTVTAIALSHIWGSLIRNYVVSQEAIPESKLTYMIWPEYYMLLCSVSIALTVCLLVGYIFVWIQHDFMSTYMIRKQQEQKSKSAATKEEPKNHNEKANIRENREEERTHIDKFVDWKWGMCVEGFVIVGGVIVFGVLYLAKIGVL